MADDKPSFDIERLQALDAAEWERLQTEYFSRIFYYVKRQIGDADAAEDVTSETFLGALKGIDRFDDRYNVEQFLFGIARKKTIDWLRAGALDDDWRLDFEAQFEETNRVESLAAARRRLDEAWGRLRARIEGMSAAELGAPMADNPILQTRPRSYGIGAVVDHTGHHRGSLAVFARLLGKVPPNPYMAEEAAQLPM